MNEIIIKGGLNPTPEDKRDLQLGSIADLPKFEKVPKEFMLEPLEIKNQGSTDFCSGFATCAMSEPQEKVLLEPAWSFAVSKMISGNLEQFGQDIRTALKVHVKYGAIKKQKSPYNLENQSSDFLRDIANWPKELFNKAAAQKKKTFFKINGKFDAFDNIRISLWKFKSPVGFGVMWGWPAQQTIMTEPKQTGTGHMIAAIGWTEIDKKSYMIIQNSYGKEAGDNGKHYFSREVINESVKKYGSYIFIDIDRKTANRYIKNKIKLNDSWFVKMLKIIKNFFIK